MSIVDDFLRRQTLEDRVWELEKQMKAIQKLSGLSLNAPNIWSNTCIHNIATNALKDELK